MEYNDNISRIQNSLLHVFLSEEKIHNFVDHHFTCLHTNCYKPVILVNYCRLQCVNFLLYSYHSFRPIVHFYMHTGKEVCAEDVRTTLKCIIFLTYNCTEEQQMPLKEMSSELSKLMTTFKGSLPQEGLLIRPEIRKVLKRSRK